MKIITQNAAYVQKNDLAYLNSYCYDLFIPASIFTKAFNKDVTIIDDTNRYEFLEFNLPEEIEFFSSLDWMVDFSSIKNLTEKELIDLGQSVCQKRDDLAKRFNSMSEDERKNNMFMISQVELLDFKILSIRDIVWMKQGRLKIKLPNGIDCPTECRQETGIKKLIKNVFNRK